MKRKFCNVAGVSVDPFGRAGQAQFYNLSRPTYPKPLIDQIVESVTPRSPGLAIDVGTGSGQLAFQLGDALGYQQVIGVDRSEQQLSAIRDEHPAVSFQVGSATDLPCDSKSADLITVAQALHWFPLQDFFDEVHRKLNSDGTLAILLYNTPKHLKDPEMNAMFHEYYFETLGSHLGLDHPDNVWDIDRRIVDNSYADYPFDSNFSCVIRSEVYSQRIVLLDQFFNYLRSWSGYQNYLTKHGRDPLIEMERKFAERDSFVTFDFPFHLIRCKI